MDDSPLWWSADELIDAYAKRELSPVEVADLAQARIAEVEPQLHAYTANTAELARQQAEAAESAYKDGAALPLSGVPISIKDAFHIEGFVSTLGSLAHIDDVAPADSGAVRRLRDAGAVFVGKTNVPEFCQSATCDNLLGPETGNPWDPTRTSGGSSGGAAASVASGTCTMALGSDGGGSIRIPATFCGLVGFKPTYGSIKDEGGFSAFSPFISAGPLARSVADANLLDTILRDAEAPTSEGASALRIGWRAHPEGRPVDPGVSRLVLAAVETLGALDHRVTHTDIDIGGWEEIFSPLVLEEEGRLRGHLLDGNAELTRYERRSIQSAQELPAAEVAAAQRALVDYRERVDQHFDDFDVLVTPAAAVPAFEMGDRPQTIDGQPASWLWGAFPFAVPFNVSAHPAIVLPVGFVDDLPVGIQLVGPIGGDGDVIRLAQHLEAALALDPFSRLRAASTP